jgi:hypothetical protein
MRDEDLLKCPLLQGLDTMHRAELIGILNSCNLREKLEQCLTEREHTTDAAKVAATAGAAPPEPLDFEKEVHSWNTAVPLWRRSSKE